MIQQARSVTIWLVTLTARAELTTTTPSAGTLIVQLATVGLNVFWGGEKGCSFYLLVKFKLFISGLRKRFERGRDKCSNELDTWKNFETRNALQNCFNIVIISVRQCPELRKSDISGVGFYQCKLNECDSWCCHALILISRVSIEAIYSFIYFK